MLRRLRITGVLVLAVGLLSLLVYQAGIRQSLRGLAEQGRADLSLAADRLTGQLQRYKDLAVFVKEDPALVALPVEKGEEDKAGGRAKEAAAHLLLLRVTDRTGLLNMAYVAADGRVLAEAKPGAMPATGYVARAMARARDGALGTAHGNDPESGRRVYVYAAPVFARGGAVTAVLLVTVNVELLEQEWRGDRPAVLFTDAAGRVFITNRSELLGWQRLPGGQGFAPPDGGAVQKMHLRHLAGLSLWAIDWGPYLPRRALHITRELPQIGMRAEALVDVAPARRLAALQAAVVALVLLMAGGALMAMSERRRALAEANARLEGRVAARTAQLSGANARLRREVAERQEAEAALKRAQDELVQAGRLSALGQMSAGISHELNQPLMAIRQFAENGALFLERDKPERAAQNLTRIAELSSRMGRIIRNLRAFARQENEPVRRIDLLQVIETVLEMTEARMVKEGVVLNWTPPEEPVHAIAGEVRLGQVLMNLLSNAMDAMAVSPRRVLSVTLTGGAQPEIRVRDTGPGIAQPERIFDPFYSTKEVGAAEGMGLGLSISYGLVQSFGGAIRGRNHPDGGAEFTVLLSTVPPAAQPPSPSAAGGPI